MRKVIDPQNQLFALTRQAVRLPSPLGACLLSLVFLFGAGLIGGIPYVIASILIGQKITLQPTISALLQEILMLVVSFGPVFLILWLWIRLYEKRKFSTLGLSPDNALFKYLRGVITGILMFSISLLIMNGLGDAQNQPPPGSSLGGLTIASVFLVYAGWMVQGPAEEIICRGWLMPVIGLRTRPWIGVLISSLLFAFYHSLNPHLNPIAILNLLLVGIFLCIFALHDGSLWGVFGWHSAWNWVQGNIFGLPVSGLNTSSITFFHFQTHGSVWITGNGFGPEGGLAVTLVLIVGLVVATLAKLKKQNRYLETPNFPV